MISLILEKLRQESTALLAKNVLRRVWRHTLDLLWIIVALPFIISILVLGVFIKVRIGSLDIGRIGGTFDAEWYLCKKNALPEGEKTIDLFYFIPTNVVSNAQWFKMWERSSLPLIPYQYFVSRIIKSIEKLNQLLPDSESYAIPLQHNWPPDKEIVESILLSPHPFLSFTPEEEVRGKELLKNMGVTEDKPFVCFHSRDSAYLNEVYPTRDWSYHDYRDSKISNYMDAADELTHREYSAIRVGSIVAEKIGSQNPNIIDYASKNDRNDFADIYLAATCNFMICSETGLLEIHPSDSR
jgi:hypothetical protein